MMVPYDQRWRLLATFNGGFIYTDVNNGSTDNGRVNEPLDGRQRHARSAIATAASRS